MEPSAALRDAARAWWNAGVTPLPVRTDGSKAPAVRTWRDLQHRRPTDTELAALMAVDHDGIGIITGAVSGGLEMLEIEGRAASAGVRQQLARIFADHDLADLWARIESGPVDVTPSGGIHWYYRIDGPVGPNAKLARRPSTPDELAAHQDAERAKLTTIPDERMRAKRAAVIDKLRGDDVPQVLIETRGEGGFSVVSPSAGRTHPTGSAWIAASSAGPNSLPVITADERDTIHALCHLLDTMPEPDAPTVAQPTPISTPRGGKRPGDDYNKRATWDELLVPLGWRVTHQHGAARSWVRPGKDRGVSATTGRNDADRLWVFTTSAAPFEPDRPYDKFGAYALIEHGGDLRAASKALAALGYGDPPEDVKLALVGSPSAIDGSSALATVTDITPAANTSGDQATTGRNQDSVTELFVRSAVGKLRYVPQWRRWLVWTGTQWRWDDVGEHIELVKRVARQLPSDSKGEQLFRNSTLKARSIIDIAKLAESDERIRATITQLDADPWELNTPAGVVDLRTGNLHPPDPAKLHTRSTAVSPDFDTTPTRWLQFLDETFGGDQTIIDYLQRIVGIAAVGEVVEQLFPFGHGVGANGKSVFIETIAAVLGRGESGYATTIDSGMLTIRRYEGHPTEIAQLAGARFVVCSEIDDGARFNETRIKHLTGRDSITARFIARDPFTFTPSHTIFMVANHRPRASVGGPAFWRRIRLIPFDHVVPEDRRDPQLPDKLQAEWPAILAWIIRGAAGYVAEGGIATPEGVAVATAEYERDEDTIGQFVDEECSLGPVGTNLVQARSGDLFRAYEAFCYELGVDPAKRSATALSRELKARYGITLTRDKKSRWLQGISLLGDGRSGDEPTLDWEG